MSRKKISPIPASLLSQRLLNSPGLVRSRTNKKERTSRTPERPAPGLRLINPDRFPQGRRANRILGSPISIVKDGLAGTEFSDRQRPTK